MFLFLFSFYAILFCFCSGCRYCRPIFFLFFSEMEAQPGEGARPPPAARERWPPVSPSPSSSRDSSTRSCPRSMPRTPTSSGKDISYHTGVQQFGIGTAVLGSEKGGNICCPRGYTAVGHQLLYLFPIRVGKRYSNSCEKCLYARGGPPFFFFFFCPIWWGFFVLFRRTQESIEPTNENHFDNVFIFFKKFVISCCRDRDIFSVKMMTHTLEHTHA